MKYRAEAVGLSFKGEPLVSYSNSMEEISGWAHLISKQHKVDVKIFETYERVLTIVKKPYEKSELAIVTPPRLLTCTCETRVFCLMHPEKGWQKK